MLSDFKRVQSVAHGLSIQDKTGIISGAMDPTVTMPMPNVPVSTLYIRTSPPELWQKIGVGDLDYKQLCCANGGNNPPTLGWNSVVANFVPRENEGYNCPKWDEIGNNIYSLKFKRGDKSLVKMTVPYDYAVGTNAFPSIHWVCSKPLTNGDEIEWEIKYVVCRENHTGDSLLDPQKTIVLTYQADGTEVAGQPILLECNPYQHIDLKGTDALLVAVVTLKKCEIEKTSEKDGRSDKDRKEDDDKKKKSNIFGLSLNVHYLSTGSYNLDKHGDWL